MKRLGIATSAVLALLAPHLASAQSPGYMDFAKNAEVYGVSISPDGKHVAMAIPSADGLETQLHIVPLDGNGEAQALRFGAQNHVTDVVWSDNDQVVAARARMEPLRAVPYSRGELVSSRIDGKNQDTLFAYVPDNGNRTGKRKDQCFASIARVLRKEPGMIIVE